MPVGPPGQPWSRPLVTFLGVPPFLALIETVTIAVHLQNMNVVGEAVEQCPRQAFGAEHFGPLVEGTCFGNMTNKALRDPCRQSHLYRHHN